MAIYDWRSFRDTTVPPSLERLAERYESAIGAERVDRWEAWVPYEFGRAKQRVSIARNAASWFESSVTLDPGGDYLALTYCAPRDVDLYAWLGKIAGRTTPLRPNNIWKGAHAPPKYSLPNQRPEVP